jgi:hypothetical protein
MAARIEPLTARRSRVTAPNTRTCYGARSCWRHRAARTAERRPVTGAGAMTGATRVHRHPRINAVNNPIVVVYPPFSGVKLPQWDNLPRLLRAGPVHHGLFCSHMPSLPGPVARISKAHQNGSKPSRRPGPIPAASPFARATQPNPGPLRTGPWITSRRAGLNQATRPIRNPMRAIPAASPRHFHPVVERKHS